MKKGEIFECQPRPCEIVFAVFVWVVINVKYIYFCALYALINFLRKEKNWKNVLVKKENK